MIGLFLAIGFTLGTSAFCSLLEAMILSTTTAEIEALKQKASKKGHLLELFKEDIEETTSAILAVNTIANTLGAVLVGGIAIQLFGESKLMAVSIGMTFSILLFSEILPKNVGVIYRSTLQPYLVYPLHWVRTLSMPISRVCKFTIRLFIRGKSNTMESSDEEIILLAHKSAKEGILSQEESNMIRNALSLDDISVHEIMTPRTVVTAWEKNQTIGETLNNCPNVPFARIPIYDETIDNCCGVVRRRDLLKAKDQDQLPLSTLMHPTIFIPENGFVSNALQECLKHQQQLAIVVDEYGSMVGVLTLEDIMELILGQEIFEKDDVAVDMRELARKKGDRLKKEGLS